MNKILKKIKPQARSLIVIDNYISQAEGIFNELVVNHVRMVNITPLLFLLEEVKNRFDSKDKEYSDGWLAPRVHASLRLYRREAADISIWEYLSLVVPEAKAYIHWRWGGQDGNIKDKNRIFGNLRRHGIARLWWVAELTRNGSDYKPTIKAFSAKSQDLINYITDVDFSHNRIAAIAYILFFTEQNENRKAKDAVVIGKALNHVLTTIMIDHLAPNTKDNINAYENWINQSPDEILMLSELPIGPNEPQVSDGEIKKVINLLDSLEV